MKVQIIECEVSCTTCGTPIASSHTMEKGLRINRIASLGAELVVLRERRKSAKKVQAKALTSRIVDVMVEIIQLGGEFDSQGFIHHT